MEVNGTVGISENYFAQKLKVTPNPFSDHTILFKEQPFANANILIENSLGQIVKQVNNVSGNSIELSSDNLPKGLYLIKVEENKYIVNVQSVIIM